MAKLPVNEDLLLKGQNSIVWRVIGVIHIVIHALGYLFSRK